MQYIHATCNYHDKKMYFNRKCTRLAPNCWLRVDWKSFSEAEL